MCIAFESSVIILIQNQKHHFTISQQQPQRFSLDKCNYLYCPAIGEEKKFLKQSYQQVTDHLTFWWNSIRCFFHTSLWRTDKIYSKVRFFNEKNCVKLFGNLTGFWQAPPLINSPRSIFYQIYMLNNNEQD